jgi:hypothetical protein
MAQQARQTFEQILFSAAPHNARVLEEKAHTASVLARTYPESAFLFRAIEGRLVERLLKILPALSSSRVPAVVLSYEVEEKEASVAVG